MDQAERQRELSVAIVMTVAIALAVISWAIAWNHDRRTAEQRFRALADGLSDRIVSRIDACRFALRATGALFDASERIDRDEWRRFVASMRPAESVPGLLGLGFARRVEPSAVAALEHRLRAEGFEGLRVFPQDRPGERAIIELIEPLDAANRRVIGYDMASDPVRRATMEIARDTGEPALTGSVRLLQDGAEGPPTGVLLYDPVYADGHRPTEPAARRAALLGFVYAPLRIHDLMAGVMPRDRPGLALEVFDDDGVRLHAVGSAGEPVHEAVRTLELPGRRWSIRVVGGAAFAQAARSAQPGLVAAVGAAMNLALFAFLRSEMRERRRAERETRLLSAEIDGRRGAEQAMRDSERRFREVVEASPTGLLMADGDGRIVLANPQVERVFGYERGDLLGRSVEELVPTRERDAHPPRRADYQRHGTRRLMAHGRDLYGLRRDGTEIPLEIGLSPMGDGRGTVLAAVVDLSARQASQAQLEAALREKTLLLDEVHHRVKNNLQVIVSLLSLQSRSAPPEAREALAECRNRVHAMALTHQLMHENGDVARLNLGDYIVRLCRLLEDSHRARQPSVTLRVEGADTPLHLALPQAIPCGLLVNELVNAAYRHAFAPGRPGTIVVALSLDGDAARLRVSDDGERVPVDASDTAPAPLGIQLVPLLVEQLGGTLVESGGTAGAVEVRFPVAAERRR